MSDRDNLDLAFALSLLALTVLVVVLGAFVLRRLPRSSHSAVLALVIVLLLILGFFSTFFPYLAVLPAIGFAIAGIRALTVRDSLHRDGGIVLLLVGLAWVAFTRLQASTLASGDDIRVDLVLTLPIMTLMGSMGWRIGSALPAARQAPGRV